MTINAWVVEDDRSIRWVLEKALSKTGLAVREFSSAEGVLAALAESPPDVMLVDIRMPGMDGLTLLKAIHQQIARLPVIIMTAHADLESAVAACQAGAFDYITKPFDIDDVLTLVERATAPQPASKPHTEALPPLADGEIIGKAMAMQPVFRAIGKLAHTRMTVLIGGESGTGKELVARALHQHSARHQGPFVAINAASIPADLLESELFGHERGAFTGAQNQQSGRFEQADGGTLFLDEIGDMPLALQTGLLRVLASGEFYRVGGRVPIKVDVRIITATHQNLQAAVRSHRFREDLYHRLNVIRINLPALRERHEDIPILARHFLSQISRELGCETKMISPACEAFLNQLPWPGNVRQLENCCRWLTVMAPGRVIEIDDLPAELHNDRNDNESSQQRDWQTPMRLWARNKLAQGANAIMPEIQSELETILIRCALEQSGGQRQEAARLLGWGRNTLSRRIKELALDI